MKKALLKDSVKEIKNTYKRFLSILLMAFLGVGFFAGIKATSPDMIDTIDQYYKVHNVYDIELVSTLGLTNSDIEELKKIDTIDNIQGTYEVDGKIEMDNKEVIAKVMCLNEINQPSLKEGRFPQNEEECVVEPLFLTANHKKIGDSIEIEVENMTNDEGKEIPYLKQKQLKIVGTIESPLYISRERGSSSLGAGKVNYYLFVTKEHINASEVYTQIYVTLKNSEKLVTASKEYEDYVEETKQKIEEIKEQRQKARQEELVAKATRKVEEAQSELDTKKQEVQDKIKQAEEDLQKGKQEIQDAEHKVNSNQKKLEQEFTNAEQQIKTAKNEITQNEEQFKGKEQEASGQFAQLEKQKQELQEKEKQVEQGLQQVKTQYNQVIEALNNPQLPPEQKLILEQTKMTLEAKKKELEHNQQQLVSARVQIENGITTGKAELEKAREQIKQGKQEIAKQENQLKTARQTANSQITSAKKELEQAKNKIKEAEGELATNKEKFEQEITQAQGKLIDANAKIAEIEEPKWYILDRYANIAYNGFTQDTQSVANIGEVFPLVFFLVATLISLTSMTRMVEEQRTQIGTLKALGYSRVQIASKYVMYASLACIIGALLGMCVGFILIPKIIWLMYQMLYEISDFSISFDLKYGTMGLVLISVCIIGATISSLRKELNQEPAMLMRPKAPKMGKRVLLEKIPFIWKRLDFSRKVTIRNIFRYKKRFLMTIIGITGCTALILVGFGLGDSIRSILPTQYEKIFNYDMQINLKNGLEEEQKQAYVEKLVNQPEIEQAVEIYMQSTTVRKEEQKEDVQIIVAKEEGKLEGFINRIDKRTKEKVELKQNEICITDKVAELIGAKQGDTIVLQEGNQEKREVKIANVVENYISHYVYMNKETYETLYGEKYETNVIFTKNTNISEEQEEKLATQIMQEKEVASIIQTATNMRILDDTMKSLNYVVVVLIVSAGLLAFVVLYNLSNVNISERIRELATIKVLGFYDKEVYSYVTRETVLLTMIGIAFGLIGGYFLSAFIMGTCETNMLRFSKHIQPISYVYASAITIIFTMIVNFVTYFALKKIDMIESLKSVE